MPEKHLTAVPELCTLSENWALFIVLRVRGILPVTLPAGSTVRQTVSFEDTKELLEFCSLPFARMASVKEQALIMATVLKKMAIHMGRLKKQMAPIFCI